MTADVPTSHRPNGREQRRAARGKARAAQLPYIQRRLPVVELLSSEAVDVIEYNAETLLEYRVRHKNE